MALKDWRPIKWLKDRTSSNSKLSIEEIVEAAPSKKKNNLIKKIGLAFMQGGGGRDEFEEPEGFDLEEIEKAYLTDSYIRTAIDKYVDFMFKAGWSVVGKDAKNVEYIKQRLSAIEAATQIPTEQLLIDIAEELIKYHNVFIVKARQGSGYTFPPGIRATPVNGTQPVTGYFILPTSTIKIQRDKHGTIKKYEQEVSGSERPITIKAEDMIHIHVDKPPGRAFGFPFLWEVLDDVKLLRQMEELVDRMIYKNIFPLMVYQVGLSEEGFQATDEEIEEVREMLGELTLDGGIVLPERHQIKTVGAEGKALSVSEYLKYFEKRVFTGLGVSETLMGRGDCYDEETQTLTDKGWKFYWEVMEGDKIGTYNPNTAQIEYHMPRDGYNDHIFGYSGKMYHFNSKHVDIKVSAEHDMWIATNKEKLNWHKVSARDLYEKGPKEFLLLEGTKGQSGYIEDRYIEIPKVEAIYNENENNKVNRFDAVEFAKFLGYYLSEGYVKASDNGRYAISISQKKEDSLARVITNIENLGLEYNIRTMKKDGTKEITIHHKSLWHYLKDNAGEDCYTKKIPKEIFNYNPTILEALRESLIDGDGSIDERTGRTSSVYYTVSNTLADDVHELCVRIGLKSKTSVTKQSKNAFGDKDIYRVLIADGGSPYRHFKRSNISEVDYDGVMYCYNVPNHLFVTRRNGKIAIQGNTANRSTSDNMDAAFKDRVKAYQKIISIFVNAFMVNELLLEGGIDPTLEEKNRVEFRFKEIDFDSKIKEENHAIQKFTQNAITHEELRNELDLDPVTDEDRLYFNMITATLKQQEAANNAGDNKDQPENQYGKKKAPGNEEKLIEATKESKNLTSELVSLLNNRWELVKVETLDLVKKFHESGDKGSFNFSGLTLNLGMAARSMSQATDKYIRQSFSEGVNDLKTQSNNEDYVYRNHENSVVSLVENINEKLNKLLVDDLLIGLNKSINEADRAKRALKIVGVFEALRFRIIFLVTTEINNAYNVGFAKTAKALGRKRSYVDVSDDSDDICQQYRGKSLDLYKDNLPPFHTNCACKLTLIKKEGS